ncbi:MAG: hypothetical protein F8N38_19005 [Hungatella sp.]|nr:hypothetical protein [Hungatella sp.]
MSSINVILLDDQKFTFSASSIDPPKSIKGGFQIILKQPVKINNKPLPSEGRILYGAGTVCQMADGQTLVGRMELTITKEKVTLNIYTA